MAEIISLIENTKKEGCPLLCEHGLSLFVKNKGRNYLIDTGASAKFIENARDLGVDLTNLDAVIISHNHYDHIGGLEALLEFNKSVKVYIKKAAQGKFYSKRRFYSKNISAGRIFFKKYSDRFIFVDEKLILDGDLHLLTCNVYDDYFFCKDSRLLERKGWRLSPDSFSHELFVVLESQNSVSIISSCSHNGIVNIVRSTQAEFPQKPIKDIVGGFHLKSLEREMSAEEIEKFISETTNILDAACQNKIYTCHCTGLAAYQLLKHKLPHKMGYLATGEELLLD